MKIKAYFLIKQLRRAIPGAKEKPRRIKAKGTEIEEAVSGNKGGVGERRRRMDKRPKNLVTGHWRL